MAENSAHLCSSMFFPTETSYLSVPAATRTARRRIFYPIVLYVLVPVRLLAMAVPRWHWMAQAAVLIGALGLGYWYWRMAAGRWLFWAFSGVDDVRSLFAFSNFDGKGISIGLEQIQKLPSQQPEHRTFWLKTHEQLFGGTPPSPTKDDPEVPETTTVHHATDAGWAGIGLLVLIFVYGVIALL